MTLTAESVFAAVEAAVSRLPEDGRPIALMTCGLAGAGKTTLSKNILARLPGYERLSIDEIVGEQHGLYGKDYEASSSLREQYEDEADEELRARLLSRLNGKKNVLLDRSFYARDDREEFQRIIADNGGRCMLVYLRVLPTGKEALWQRIIARSAKERDANSALDISRELFEQYWNGFEGPDGEGEIIIDVL